ncbi:MAG: hypothetical protein VXY90_07645, partial [Pseudomonadota bacterium]|nr:hypothetical protein [Pseudomonadota bacterium]
MRKVLERERVEAMEYSRRHPPKHRTETLIQREDRYMQEQRAAKAAMRAAQQAPGGGTLAGTAPATFGSGAMTWLAGNTQPGASALPPSMQVP